MRLSAGEVLGFLTTLVSAMALIGPEAARGNLSAWVKAAGPMPVPLICVAAGLVVYALSRWYRLRKRVPIPAEASRRLKKGMELDGVDANLTNTRMRNLDVGIDAKDSKLTTKNLDIR